MLAVALNYRGVKPGSSYVPILRESFRDFLVVRMNPYTESEKPLELCQPQEYQEVIKEIEESWDPSQKILELRGLPVKLQKAVRYMFFFDENRRYDNVLLDGSDGINDFPWAVQVFIVQPPLSEQEQDSEWVQSADIIVIMDPAERNETLDWIRRQCPEVPVFFENAGKGLSDSARKGMEEVFAKYINDRQRIKEWLTENQKDLKIRCLHAHRIAGRLRVSSFLFGNVCDELGYSITNCGLGCF